jgi:hypothetical protein
MIRTHSTPRASVRDGPLLIGVDVFAVVTDRSVARLDEVVVRDFCQLAVGEFPLLDHAGGDAADVPRQGEHRDLVARMLAALVALEHQLVPDGRGAEIRVREVGGEAGVGGRAP